MNDRFLLSLRSIMAWIRNTLRTHPYLFLILFVAFAYRFSGIFWGLPPLSPTYYHPDEPKIIEGALNFPLDIIQRQDLRYPTGLHYTLALITWPGENIYQYFGRDPMPFVHLTGRLLSVTFGTGTILLVYFLTRRFYDRLVALVAATALGFSMYHVTNSAWATTDVATSFFLTLFLLLLDSAIKKRSSKYAVFAGISLGMLVGVKYTGAIAIIPLFVLLIAHEFSQQNLSLGQKLINIVSNKTLWIVGLVSIMIFLLTTPTILLNTDAFVDSIRYEQDRLAQTQLPLNEIEVWRSVFSNMVKAIGFPLTAAACLGLGYIFFSRRNIEIAFGSLIIGFFIYFGNSLAPRYIILVMPILAILVARALMLFSRNENVWVRGTNWAICTAVLLHAFWYSTAAVLSRYPDSRTASANYISENILPGSQLGIAYTSEEYNYPYHGWRYPYIDFAELSYVDFLDSPEFVLVSSYDADRIKRTLEGNLFEDDFVFPESLAHQWYLSSPPSPRIFAFFNDLYFSDQSVYVLVERFSPPPMLAPIEFPSPTIEIYQKR